MDDDRTAKDDDALPVLFAVEWRRKPDNPRPDQLRVETLPSRRRPAATNLTMFPFHRANRGVQRTGKSAQERWASKEKGMRQSDTIRSERVGEGTIECTGEDEATPTINGTITPKIKTIKKGRVK